MTPKQKRNDLSWFYCLIPIKNNRFGLKKTREIRILNLPPYKVPLPLPPFKVPPLLGGHLREVLL